MYRYSERCLFHVMYTRVLLYFGSNDTPFIFQRPESTPEESETLQVVSVVMIVLLSATSAICVTLVALICYKRHKEKKEEGLMCSTDKGNHGTLCVHNMFGCVCVVLFRMGSFFSFFFLSYTICLFLKY